MRVIKHGNLYEKKCTCIFCGCEFMYVNKDIQPITQICCHGVESADMAIKKVLICPECKFINYIEENE